MLRLGFALGLVVGALSAAADEAPAPKAAEWNVLSFGAVADGETDNTAAFQKALDEAGTAGGGIVTVPAGRYSFSGVLRLPKAVTLRGVFTYAPAHSGIRDNTDEKPVYGSVLLPRAGAGSEAGDPFILVQSNGSVQGVCVYYPDQKPDAAEPTPYPYAIALRGNNPSVIDVELLNPYNGIDASQNQRHLVRNVHGQPIHIGVFVDQIYDIGRLENVHWNPWWSMSPGIYGWQTEHGVGFLFGRTDWQYVLNTFCFGYNVGYKFIETETGVCNGNFLGIGADDCFTAVQVEGSAPFGVLITNGEFVSFHGPDPTMVRVTSTHKGSVRFVNCAFWGPCNRIAVVDGPGTVGFSDCTFTQWAYGTPEARAIEALGGSLIVRGCEFQQNKAQVFLGEGVKKAIVSENLIKGAVRIVNESKGKTLIANNLGDD